MDALDALALQIEWGADEALQEVAADRLAAPPPRPPADRAAPVRPAPRAAPPPAAAGGAPDLASLLDAYAAYTGCALRDTATSFVRPSGEPSSGLVWLTGPPSGADDQSGLPASGAEGDLLDRMLASIGLARARLLLVPLLPWRPPGGRPPSPAERQQCLPFLHRLLALARPHTVVLEAGLPAQTFLPRGAARPRRPEADKCTPVDIALPDGAEPVAAVAIPSLSSVRLSADRRREAWAALRLLRRHLDAGLPKC